MTLKTAFVKALVLTCFLFDSNPCLSEIVVAYNNFPPLAYEEGEQPAGFAVSLFRKCAELMEVRCHFVQMPLEEAFEKLTDGEIDVAIGGISITSEREAKFDFTTPTLTGGLCCMSIETPSVLPELSSRGIRLLASLFLFLLAFGHILWFFERGQDAIDDRYFPGIFESFWCLFATMSTVGYGDIAPRRWAGRIISIFVMLLGISFFGIITATFTTDFLVEAYTNTFADLGSVYGLTVGCKRGTTSEVLLSRKGVEYSAVDDFLALVEGLHNGFFQVAVHDEIVARNELAGNQRIKIKSLSSTRQQYGFAVPEESLLLEKLNRSILALKESGQYELIKSGWPYLPK